MVQAIEKRQDGELTIFLKGRLDHRQSGRVWRRMSSLLQDASLTLFVCDLQDVHFIDTAGIALLRDVEQRCADRGLPLSYRNLPPRAERFLGRERRPAAPEERSPEEQRPGWIAKLGGWCAEKLSICSSLITFLGSFVAAGLFLLRHPRHFRIRDFLIHLQQVGSESALLICALNGLTGMVVVFQGETVANTFGAPIYVADMVARSVTAQMAPVLTAILIAGRSGTSFAAKIGTMKIRQELDVLAVMNFDVMGFLVLPRVIAVSLATPLLTMLADASGVLGGLLTSMTFLDISAVAFINKVQATLHATDILTGLIKGLAFGLVVGLTGCFHGLQTENTADSVGLRTTAAVVSSIFIIILADTVFAALFNKFGW